MKPFERITKYVRLLRKYNKLELEYDVLKEYTKEKCFESLIDKIGEPQKIESLIEENKKLRIKNKELKEQLKCQRITIHTKK